MRAPEFWNADSGNGIGVLLAPVGWVYGGITTLRASRQARWAAPVPVICVGNIVMGGAGKTPVCMALAKMLMAAGRDPHILLRGYGGKLGGPLRVDPSRHSHFDVGDEALLHAHETPTWIGKDRVASAKAAIDAGAGILIMDDGFQNPGLAKSLNLIVFDGTYGIGNRQLFPAGPLRESLSSGLKRAHAVIILGEGGDFIANAAGMLPVIRGTMKSGPTGTDLRGKDVVAFAGIGRPGKFFDALEDLGANIVHRVAFPDHHAFADPEIEIILEESEERNAVAVTTAKDLQRVPEKFRAGVTAMNATIDWESEETLRNLVLSCEAKA